MFPQSLITAQAREKANRLLRLKTALAGLLNPTDSGTENQEPISLCEAAVEAAGQLLQSYGLEPLEPQRVSSRESCLAHLDQSQKSFSLGLPLSQQGLIMQSLLADCQALLILLRKSTQQDRMLVGDQQLSDRFHQMMSDATVNTFLLDLVNYWNQCELTDFGNSRFFADLDEQQLQIWVGRFVQEEFILLYKTLFFYKSKPQSLFDQPVHPEKLISLQIRLDFLYQFIENLQQQLSYQVQPVSTINLQDYLLHGDELPAGIMIEADPAFRNQIIQAVSTLKMKIRSQFDQDLLADQIFHMRQAYKFWFNPNRLIDSAMVLQQHYLLQIKPEEFDDEGFRKFLTAIYQSMDTSDCLDLYGFFANKDSTYLMRTLEAGAANQLKDWVAEMKPEDCSTLRQVHRVLGLVMTALTDLLAERTITTQPYPFVEPSEKPLQPGQRIILAIQRVVSIYSFSDRTAASQTLEDLFSLVENSEAF